MAHALIVDDDVESAERLRGCVAGEGLSVAQVRTLRDARRQISLHRPDLILLDLSLPDGNGLDLYSDPELLADSKVVLTTGRGSLETSIQALRLHATDYLVKPIQLGALRDVLSRFKASPCGERLPESNAREATTGRPERFGPLWGRSEPMVRMYDQIGRVADTGISVFITGESGTGKELVAQTLHDRSRRCKKPFVAVNCAAVSPHLIESEMFGHEKGSFTGADRLHQGYFELANGGTLFLDEITEMPMELQVKLLRVIETGTYLRVGSTRLQTTDVRVIAATNRKPQEAVASGRLREDLYYRLNVFPIAVPSLRERLQDVPILAEHFLQAIGRQEGRMKTFGPQALATLSSLNWPGNVRELRNAVQRAYVMAPGDVIDDPWVPRRVDPAADVTETGRPSPPEPTDPCLSISIGTSLTDAERKLILGTLQHCRYHRERTAAVLGISMKTLYNRLKAYSLTESIPPACA